MTGKRNAALCLFVLTLAVYWPVKDLDFIAFDDELYVTQNARIQAGLSAENIAWALTALRPVYWHPLAWMSHMLDADLFGLSPRGPHLVNLFLHAGASILLFLALHQLTGALWRSAIAAAFFAVHPLSVESVAWVPERKNVLSALFWFLTILAYARYAASPSARRFAWVVTAFLMGLMSKPMLVTLPLTLLLVDFWPLTRRCPATHPADTRSVGMLIKEKWVLFLMSAACGILTWVAQRDVGAVVSFDRLHLSIRVENALVSSVTYIGLALWPDRLAIFYPYPVDGYPAWQSALAAALLAGVSFLVWRLRRHGYLVFGWLWFLITLIPVIGLIQAGAQSMADRHSYIPLVGLYVLAVWAVADLAGRRRSQLIGAAAMAVVLIGAAAYLTRQQLTRWKTSETLYRHTLAVTRNNALAENNLGSVLARLGRLDEAEEHLREAIRIHPRYALPHLNLGSVYHRRGEADSAVEELETAIRKQPALAGPRRMLAVVLSQKGDTEGAIKNYRHEIRINPDDVESLKNLGVELARAGLLDDARANFERALAVNARDSDAHFNLALTFSRLGDGDAASERYGKALKIDPGFAKAHYNFGLLLARAGRHAEAIGHFEAAVRRRPGDSEFHNNFGACLAQMGNLEAAIDRFQEAVHLDSGNLEALGNLESARATLRMTSAR